MVTYFDIIQAYFTQLTGRFVMFSGRDMALLEGWRRQGASAAQICRGIRDAVRQMDEAQPPRSLYNCRAFIEPYIERARTRLMDTSQAPDAPSANTPSGDPALESLITRAQRALERAGASCELEVTRAAYRQAWHGVRAISPRDPVEVQVERLMALEEALAEAFYLALDERARGEVDAHAQREEAARGLCMSAEAWQRHVVARRRRALVRGFGMVSLLD